MDTSKDTSIEQNFDGNQFSPQMTVALKNLIYSLIPKATPPPNAIFGRAHSGSPTSIPDVQNTKVVIDSADIAATGITFDSVNNRYTCITAGTYQVVGVVCYSDTVAGKLYAAKIYKNGSDYSDVFSQAAVTSANTDFSIVISDIVTLAVGGYVELWTFHNSGLAEPLSGVNSWLAIAKIQNG